MRLGPVGSEEARRLPAKISCLQICRLSDAEFEGDPSRLGRRELGE